ncbi:MAG: ribonuclease R [Acetobacteraceae bacterium]|nr:ribonuclease R [Acetobacteraceae bacterium]
MKREARTRAPRRALPAVAPVLITGTDEDGDAIGQPLNWTESGPPPLILMGANARALASGQRVLARLRPAGPGRYEGRTIRLLDGAPTRVLGIFRPGPHGDRIEPTNRRAKAEWLIPPGQNAGAQAGEIVWAEPLPSHRYGMRPARVLERLGHTNDARSVSLIAIATHDIPHIFPEDAPEEAARARAPRLGTGTDLRDIPLVTIDGEDARDFDDAVHAEATDTGFRLIVAIADVARYVRPNSALDREARLRGNSVYFPDRVVPMLPEALSNGWCSLRPGENRACLFAEIHVSHDGRKLNHRFGRGVMRSAARLTYEQVQKAEDAGDTLGLPLPTLYAAFRALLAQRQQRGTLDLDLPERQVMLDDAGHVTAITPRPRLDSHRLIEEFMILANVAAAEELERLHAPCVYRVHAPPSAEKLEDLRAFLKTLDISLPPGPSLHPRDLDRVLRRVADTPEAPLINEVILRSQSQAAYSPDNIGHFGLALSRYAHFTSPIRRYADLLVHRSLITALKFGRDGLPVGRADALEETAEHITMTERRAQAAERDASDRYVAAFMAGQVGTVFAARISGVTRFGLFVTLPENGASGIVPRSALPDDYWRHNEREQTLTGSRTGLVFRLGQPVEVRLLEANPVTGGLAFGLMQEASARRGRKYGRRTRR